jgi:hypothetical protein
MIEGIKNSNPGTVITKKQPLRPGSPDSVRTGPAQDDIAVEDRVTLNRKETGPFTYTKPMGTEQRSDQVFMMLQRLVAKILQDQKTADQIDNGDMETIDIDKLTPEIAKTLVANDGHWKPEQTAARITAFSITISGNSPEKLARIKEHIDKGFLQAKEALGGELPKMSNETYSAVMQKLDEWAGQN